MLHLPNYRALNEQSGFKPFFQVFGSILHLTIHLTQTQDEISLTNGWTTPVLQSLASVVMKHACVSFSSEILITFFTKENTMVLHNDIFDFT